MSHEENPARKSAPATPAAKTTLSPLARSQRAREITRLYTDGKTLQQIGDIFHLTRERIRQILLEHSFRENLPEHQTPNSERIARQQEIFNTFRQMLALHGDPAKAARAMGYTSYQHWLPRLRHEFPIAYHRLRLKIAPFRRQKKRLPK